MDEKIRHYRHNIYVSGIGVIVFGIWTIIKFLFEVSIEDNEIIDFDELSKDEQRIVTVIYISFIIAIAILIFVIHYLIGSSAIKVAKGARAKIIFLFFTILFCAMNVLSILLYFYNLKNLDNIDTVIASALIDITLSYILADIVISIGKVKRLEKNRNK